jgi:hypothetical protein
MVDCFPGELEAYCAMPSQLECIQDRNCLLSSSYSNLGILSIIGEITILKIITVTKV